MARPDEDEARLRQTLEARYNIGELGSADVIERIEQFRALRAQRRSADYALYSAWAAAVSTAFAIASFVISIFALMQHHG